MSTNHDAILSNNVDPYRDFDIQISQTNVTVTKSVDDPVLTGSGILAAPAELGAIQAGTPVLAADVMPVGAADLSDPTGSLQRFSSAKAAIQSVFVGGGQSDYDLNAVLNLLLQQIGQQDISSRNAMLGSRQLAKAQQLQQASKQREAAGKGERAQKISSSISIAFAGTGVILSYGALRAASKNLTQQTRGGAAAEKAGLDDALAVNPEALHAAKVQTAQSRVGLLFAIPALGQGVATASSMSTEAASKEAEAAASERGAESQETIGETEVFQSFSSALAQTIDAIKEAIKQKQQIDVDLMKAVTGRG